MDVLSHAASLISSLIGRLGDCLLERDCSNDLPFGSPLWCVVARRSIAHAGDKRKRMDDTATDDGAAPAAAVAADVAAEPPPPAVIACPAATAQAALQEAVRLLENVHEPALSPAALWDV